MPSYELEYPKQPFSTVNRYGIRASYALETIHHIINSAQLVHVSFAVPDSPFPMMLPMIGQMGSFSRPSADTGAVLDLYLHGYVSSRIMNLSRDPNSSSHVDGLVLALTPNSRSYNYRSAVLFGHATVVTGVEEKLYAMELITNGVVPDRWRNTRVPPNNGEMQSTSVLRVNISAGSAKIRSGMPNDDKVDTSNKELLSRVWTGVIPVRVEKVPSYLSDYVKDYSEDSKMTAMEAASKPTKGAKSKQDD
ncbi:uncharacterized protein BCR38DRAFT_459267 [Pseudomassariella vexata]|uniref:Flavin-nucleotide-binding protein n=1 Tax=Pseudomassariella vexata TaxID=1141098 RepID=A0A1Y2DRQ0_9PEZI|nr:uncharacterized protein BCR38DRAFT_459267 [Pseudomassariella vexata]ORY61365.1 hypothetical protein BCR38DRAFT_459267 [Pseudomassariella vexata]